MEVVDIKKILVPNLLIYIYLHCVRSLSWCATTLATLLGRLKWILDIIWPLNQHFKLLNQRNWLKQVWMLKFWSVINCFFMNWTKKLTLVWDGWSVYSSWIYFNFITKKILTAGLIFNDFGPQGKLLESMLNCWT